MTMILLTAALWAGGGVLFVHSALLNPHAAPNVAETSRETMDGLTRCEPAAWVAAALFIAVWPAVFVGLHVAKWR